MKAAFKKHFTLVLQIYLWECKFYGQKTLQTLGGEIIYIQTAMC